MMEQEICPIIHGYAKAFRSFVDTAGLKDLYPYDLGLFDALMGDEGQLLGDYPSTCLRGFKCVGWMCDVINGYPWFGAERAVLAARSWEGLTSLKEVLERLEREVTLDIAEMQLGGKSTQGSFTARPMDEQAARTVLKSSSKSIVVKNALVAVRVLRPYLKNRESKVNTIGICLMDVDKAAGVTVTSMVDRLIELSTVRA